MKKIILAIFLLLMLSVFVSAANCPPSVPKTYYGGVSYNNAILTGNFEIRANIGSSTGDNVGIGSVSNGKYTIDISPCSGTTGTVYFFINNVTANPNGAYSGMNDWGREVNLSLTIDSNPPSKSPCGNIVVDAGEECDGTNLAGRNINACGTGWTGTIFCNNNCLIDYSNCTANLPFCGDAVCNNGETCSSCAVDCGACPSGSSSGGGGSSSSTTTISPTTGTIYAVSETQVNDGITKEIKASDKVEFSISGEKHTLNLNSITGNSVSITIRSEPVTFVLEIGDEKKIDFDNDKFYDLKVKLEEIIDKKAKIKIQSIHEEVPQPAMTNQTGENNRTSNAGITGNVVGFAKSKIGIGLIIGIIIVIAGIAIIVSRKRK